LRNGLDNGQEFGGLFDGKCGEGVELVLGFLGFLGFLGWCRDFGLGLGKRMGMENVGTPSKLKYLHGVRSTDTYK
jgi:hypothetical protein